MVVRLAPVVVREDTLLVQLQLDEARAPRAVRARDRHQQVIEQVPEVDRVRIRVRVRARVRLRLRLRVKVNELLSCIVHTHNIPLAG